MNTNNINFRKEFFKLYQKEIDEKVEYYKDLMEQEKQNEQKAQEERIVEAEKAKIKEKMRERELKRRARELAMQELADEGIIERSKKRESIPQDVQDKVWNRDNGKCVQCGNNENLEFDHIIPFSKGGSNTVRNLQLLCQKCNREKSNSIG